MGKTIIFCADGTWDGTGAANELPGTFPSNVLKLFWALESSTDAFSVTSSEIEVSCTAADGSVLQCAKYLHGIGDSNNYLASLAGGSIGFGLIARVLRGYTYISRNYAPGDAIVITGFSRGAYTARALGGMIAATGLLDWNRLGLNPNGSDDNGYKYAAAAWFAYQHATAQDSDRVTLLGRLQAVLAASPDLIPWLTCTPIYVTGVPIQAIGVWETVGSLGIPEITPDDTSRLDLLRFADQVLSDKVAFGFHAVAADEQRVDFTPTLWNERLGVTQRYFAGAHADVGGGYTDQNGENLLAAIPLQWMIDQLVTVGVQFRGNAGPLQDSALAPMHAPWLASPFTQRPQAYRHFPAKSVSTITCDQAIATRLGQLVTTVNPNSSTMNVRAPYVPIALINAGYVSAQGLTVS